MVRFLRPGCARRMQAAGRQGLPVHEGKTSSEEPPTGALWGLTTGKLVTQAPTSKHVPPPSCTAGCRRCFLQTWEREFPSCSYLPSSGSANTAHSLPQEKGLCPGRSVSSSLVTRANLPGAVLAGPEGNFCSGLLLLEYTDVATNFQALTLSW